LTTRIDMFSVVLSHIYETVWNCAILPALRQMRFIDFGIYARILLSICFFKRLCC